MKHVFKKRGMIVNDLRFTRASLELKSGYVSFIKVLDRDFTHLSWIYKACFLKNDISWNKKKISNTYMDFPVAKIRHG